MTNNAEARAREVLGAAGIRPHVNYADHSFPAYSAQQMLAYGNERAAQEREANADTLDTERYVVAIALQSLKRSIDGRRWLSEPGRGSYTYDDERYQAEFGQALDEIDAALQPLRKIAGDWSDCPRDPLRVAANRSAAFARIAGE